MRFVKKMLLDTFNSPPLNDERLGMLYGNHIYIVRQL
jgi:hypothetical protein